MTVLNSTYLRIWMQDNPPPEQVAKALERVRDMKKEILKMEAILNGEFEASLTE